ncbi:Abi family protein [Rhizobium ruizarguesonis]|uniref:Abi family protein n=1 Tax=Rhizobium ruizarguesonis TaxID=2081791 RepID=UPI00103068EB|nr:Abi family protein [Rhizobium ruizarguesonis]TBD43406.1 Abi family protein [Rhizobium ruizarguesonis]
MPHRPYTKLHKTPAQLAQHLIERGLPLPGRTRSFAEKKIAEIGYERLRIYFRSRRQLHLPDKPFIPGTTFKDIVALYEFDERLRLFCFLHTGRFEVALRNQLSEIVSDRYGSHPFFDNAGFQSAKTRATMLGRLSDIFYKKNDQRARHYFDEYNPPMLPPIWVLKEFMTFGNLSHAIEQMSNPVKNDLATAFGLPTYDMLENWVKVLNDLRNICAHHDRLFNRSFQKQPKKYISKNIPAAPQHKLKALLECLEYMLSLHGFRDPIVATVAKMIQKCPAVSPNELGY